MSAKTNHFKIGLFVLAGLALFVAGLLAFGARSYFQEKTTFETCVPGDVEGLGIGSIVKLRGVPIGQVTRIDFTWNLYPDSHKSYVVIEFQARPSIAGGKHESLKATIESEVKKGLRAQVKGVGITGTSIVSLEYVDPTNSPLPEIDFTPRHYYVPSSLSQFSQILSSLEKSLQNIERLDFAQVAQSVSGTLTSVNKLIAKVEAVDFGGFSSNVNSVVVEFKTTNLKLQDAIDEVRDAIKDMKVGKVAANADSLVSELRVTNTKLQNTLDRVNTAPLAETVTALRESATSLDQVLDQLKRYPSGFLFGQPPPPAQSLRRPTK